ncbi:DUF4335 domain-containing protein [Altericista sp. CCNU0014]|uniref:DUF4335 domain-containing protein n=1 Tax=Altericista sp. CCNU0014 TaxID=3082949 RepID=UPI00384C1963
MPVLSPTLSKLYTPPTCTLEVTAKASPLSRWTRTPVVKSLQFLLSFDSLAQRSREPVEIQGDRTQLSALTETVTQYVQTVLASRSTDLPLASPSDEPLALPGLSASAAPHALSLRPRSLLTHELQLGDLATAESGPSVLLKASQLYDLATALEDCTADLQHLPAPIAAERPSVLPLLRSAAIVLVTVGLGTATWKLFQTGPVAVRPSSPASTTAMAPTTVPSPAAPAPLPSVSSKPLNLPSIQLPTRSANPLGARRPDNETSDRAEPPAPRRSPAPLDAGAKTLPPQGATSLPSIELQQSEPNAAGGQENSLSSTNMARSKAPSQLFESAPIPAPKTATRETLFDAIPQVAEVRDYVASRWQPSPPPPKTLEYRVTLNGDGSLGAVEPLGTAAQQYLDRVPLPKDASAFVSPVAAGTRPSIRLLLRQDGTVQTFLDERGQ